MGNKVTIYVLVNVILLLMAALLVCFLAAKYDKNSLNTATDLMYEVNTFIEGVQTEENDKKNEESTNLATVVPIIVDENVQDITVNATNVAFKYYYNQLDQNSKKIYECIENNIDNMRTGTYKIKLPNEVAKVLDETNGNAKLEIQFQSAWDAILMDRVDLFFIDPSKISLEMKTTTYGVNKTYSLTIGPGNTGHYLADGFNNEQIVNMAINQTNNIRSQIISQLSGDDYNKIKQVHNWIIDNLEYGTEKSGNNSYNIYGALVNKETVCEGYAEAFKYIMDALEIPCILVTGKATNSEGNTENHEWNYVKINGTWYGIDVTWDDPIIQGWGSLTNSLRYKYFLKGREDMGKNHFPSGQFSSKGINFSYPELENNY